MATTTVAVIGPAVRLVVFDLLVRSDLVPRTIPRVIRPPVVTVPDAIREARKGRMVFPSTPDINMANLAAGLYLQRRRNDYSLVGGKVVDERGDGKSQLVFTFCHRQYLSDDPPHPNFVERRGDIEEFFRDATTNNLWTAMGFLNPYLMADGVHTGQSVLMLKCTGRKALFEPDGTPVMVYEGGREKATSPGQFTRGIGAKVSLTERAEKMNLVGNEIRLVTK